MISASPKQPQSATGFRKAMYKVRVVITAINDRAKIVDALRYMPKIMNTPNRNSRTINIIATVSARGINCTR